MNEVQNTNKYDEIKEKLKLELSYVIGGDAYDCNRVWDAWDVNTMTEEDFEPVIDRIDEITDSVLDIFDSFVHGLVIENNILNELLVGMQKRDLE